MPDCGDIERGIIASYARSRIKRSSCWFWQLGIDERFTNGDHKASLPEGFEIITMTSDHAYAVGDLPLHHRDPFDRMLIAQAKSEGFTVVTHDAVFRQYEISTMDA